MLAKAPRYVRAKWVILALTASILSLASTARAEIISISSVGFQLLCFSPCSDASQDFTFNNGLLIPAAASNFYAPVPFPTNGQNVCSFSLVYQDINNNNALTARLLRKPFAVGGNPTAAPIVMATAVSDLGVVSSIRIKTTTVITQPRIVKGNGLYFVIVEAPTININFLGVLIDYRPTCP